MRVFITGANGFIGRTLATRLRREGHEVSGVDLRAGRSRTDLQLALWLVAYRAARAA